MKCSVSKAQSAGHSRGDTTSDVPKLASHTISLSAIPVISPGVDRGNSAIKLVKTVLRSPLQQARLSGHLLTFVHKGIKLDYSAIIDAI